MRVWCQPVDIKEWEDLFYTCLPRKIRKEACSGVTVLFLLPRCAHRSKKQSETGVWDGHSAGVCFIHLPALPHPHPSVSNSTSRHLSPPDGLFRSSSHHLFSLTLCLLYFICFWLLPVFLFQSLPLSPWVPDGQINNGTATRSGVRPSYYQQHAWDSLHCLAYFHMTPRKQKSFTYKVLFYLLHAPFVIPLCYCLLITFPLLCDEALPSFAWRWQQAVNLVDSSLPQHFKYWSVYMRGTWIENMLNAV